MTLLPLIRRFITPAFLRYLVVGGVGFVLDAGGAEIFYHLGLDVHAARALSMTGAIGCTYLFHRYYTFTDSRKPVRTSSQFVAFGAVQLTAAALNYAIFCLVLWLQPFVMPAPLPGLWQDVFNVFAIGAGVGAGLVFNFLMLRLLVFPAGTPEEAAAKGEADKLSWRRLRTPGVWVVFAAGLIVSAASRVHQVLRFPDFPVPLGPLNPDVWVRLAQVRQFLTGRDFFSHAVAATNAPFGGISTPWTRPVDLILSAFYYLTTPAGVPITERLMLAACWMAPVLFLLAVALLAGAARREFKGIHVTVAVILLSVLNAWMTDYFTPGDADHHGFMSMLWCGILCLITLFPPRIGAAAAAGALLGGITWVSPEGLLLAAPVYALLGLEALYAPERMAALAAMTAGAALVAALGLAVERPFDAWLTPAYDTLSIVHVCLLAAISVAAIGLALVYAHGAGFRARILGVCAAAAGVAAFMYAVFPKFFQGPMADADPFIFQYFLPNVAETQPLFSLSGVKILHTLADPLLAAALLVLAFRHGGETLRAERRRYLALLAALLAYTFALTSVQIRWDYYLQPVAIVLCAALLPGIAGAAPAKFLALFRGVPRSWRMYFILWAAFAIVTAAIGLSPAKPQPGAGACLAQMRYVIQTQKLQPLLGPKAILFAPADAGGEIEFFTPYRIIASNYHREGTGLRDLRTIETATSAAQARKTLKERQVSATLFCPSQYPDSSWLHSLSVTQKYPSWLKPVPGLGFMEISGPVPVLAKVKE